MTIIGSITSLTNTHKIGKNNVLNNSIGINSCQGINSNSSNIGDINRTFAAVIGGIAMAITGSIVGGIDYAIEGAIAGLAKGLSIGFI